MRRGIPRDNRVVATPRAGVGCMHTVEVTNGTYKSGTQRETKGLAAGSCRAMMAVHLTGPVPTPCGPHPGLIRQRAGFRDGSSSKTATSRSPPSSPRSSPRTRWPPSAGGGTGSSPEWSPSARRPAHVRVGRDGVAQAARGRLREPPYVAPEGRLPSGQSPRRGRPRGRVARAATTPDDRPGGYAALPAYLVRDQSAGFASGGSTVQPK
jgi:hypothetical protein